MGESNPRHRNANAVHYHCANGPIVNCCGWTVPGSNRSPQLCHSCALPNELTALAAPYFITICELEKLCLSEIFSERDSYS